MRGLKTTVALVVVLGGLFAYIYFVTWKQPEGVGAGPAATKLDKVYAGLQADKIDEIHVHTEAGDSTVLKKDKDGWKIDLTAFNDTMNKSLSAAAKQDDEIAPSYT